MAAVDRFRIPTPGDRAGKRASRRTPRAGMAAFSLLELLAVLAIIAVLLGLVAPALGNHGGRDLHGAAEQLLLRINQARQEAVVSARIWRVVFNMGAGTYHFEQREGARFVMRKEAPLAAAELPAGIRFSTIRINGEQGFSVGRVHLFPTGEQDTLRLTLSDEEQQRIISMGAVGEARPEMP